MSELMEISKQVEEDVSRVARESAERISSQNQLTEDIADIIIKNCPSIIKF